MKNIFVTAFAFVALTAGAFEANAQEKTLRALLGMTQGNLNLGADFEMKQSSAHGLGGYFFMQTDDDTANPSVYGVMALGANMPIHLLNDSMIDVYVAPGFGILMIDDYGSGAQKDDETTFGPSLKIGAEYQVSPQASIGLQYMNYYNWFSDDVTFKAEYVSAAATFAF